MKTCSKCGTRRSLDEFPKKKTSSDGHRGVCTPCYRTRERERERTPASVARRHAYNRDNAVRQRQLAKDWASRNADRRVAVAKETRRRLRQEAYDALTGALHAPAAAKQSGCS